jgi:hypothetical protein
MVVVVVALRGWPGIMFWEVERQRGGNQYDLYLIHRKLRDIRGVEMSASGRAGFELRARKSVASEGVRKRSRCKTWPQERESTAGKDGEAGVETRRSANEMTLGAEEERKWEGKWWG